MLYHYYIDNILRSRQLIFSCHSRSRQIELIQVDINAKYSVSNENTSQCKVGEFSHVGVMNYMPISLIFFFLITMETYIHSFAEDEVLRKEPLHSKLFLYREGVSAKMALHAFTSRVAVGVRELSRSYFYVR